MSIKVYCLKYPEDCGCDPDMTLSIQKAKEWLEEGKKYGGYQMLEYVIEDDKIADQWNRCWFYDKEGYLHVMVAKDYFD